MFRWPFLHYALFSELLHSHYTITIHLYQSRVNSHEQNRVCPENWITLWSSSDDQFSYVITAHQFISRTASDWMLCNLLHVTTTTRANPTRQSKHKVNALGRNLTYCKFFTLMWNWKIKLNFCALAKEQTNFISFSLCNNTHTYCLELIFSLWMYLHSRHTHISVPQCWRCQAVPEKIK